MNKAKMIQPVKNEKINRGGQINKRLSNVMNGNNTRANSLGANQFKHSYSNGCSSPLVSAINLKKSPPRFNVNAKVGDNKYELNLKKNICKSYKKTPTMTKDEIKISSFNRLGSSENKI